jgi:SAM-dependent methyltransferase
VDTLDYAYTQRLIAAQRVWWKRLLRVQAPYGWNLRRMRLGAVLEVGCGIGRNLAHLRGRGVGVDHNPFSVAAAREVGLDAYTTDEFLRSPLARPGVFDSLLLSHIVEHLSEDEASALIGQYVDYLKPGGLVVLITPQEVGHRSDPTHVTFMDFAALRRVGAAAGLRPSREFSFPFPRAVGRLFIYNEFVSVMRRGAAEG